MAKYTAEQTEFVKSEYAKNGNDGLDAIAKALGESFTVRSVRAKLIREQVYVKPEKAPTEPRRAGPTKTEILKEMGEMVEFDVDGLTSATRDALMGVLEFVKRNS